MRQLFLGLADLRIPRPIQRSRGGYERGKLIIVSGAQVAENFEMARLKKCEVSVFVRDGAAGEI